MDSQSAAELLTGQLKHVATVAKDRTGKRPSPPTVWRHCRKGIKGIRLPALWTGSYWATTDRAYDWWLQQQTAAALKSTDDAEPDATDAELEAAGLL